MLNGPDGLLKKTPLHDLHQALGGKMVPFAGYHMPVDFGGILKEHNHTRNEAGLFDVSHMGQAFIHGKNAAKDMERLVPGDIAGLAVGGQRYTQLTNDAGGILDDLMVTNLGDRLYVVVNAACKEADFAHIRAAGLDLEILEEQALLALQGPMAAQVMGRYSGALTRMAFMTSLEVPINGVVCRVSRSGYTGEDGYEISLPGSQAQSLAEQLLDAEQVQPVGLGARDSLRLEAGLCLYGNDIDATTTPVEASLLWSIGKRRRAEGGFPGDTVIQRQIAEGVERRRVGISLEGRAPARAHAEITDDHGAPIGAVTSGGFGPTVGGPIAMGYVNSDAASEEGQINVIIRKKACRAKVIRLPFVPHRFYRG